MSKLYAVRLLYGSWLTDSDGQPACASRSVMFAKLRKLRAVNASQAVGAKVLAVTRVVTLKDESE